MTITQAILTSDVVYQARWGIDWAWGLPLIVLTVLFHVTGLGLMSRSVDSVTTDEIVHRHPVSAFMLVMGTVTMLATVMHAIEATIWCLAYRALNALPDTPTAMLYSLNALTSYGHDNLNLEGHWKLLGAIEALNGWLLFGLTTAFLFGIMVRVRTSLNRYRDHEPA